MDSGFKEGIDLFDIKYVHMFEPAMNAADQKQVIGRGTRTCGQKGLIFHPTQGWPLEVFIYDLEIPERLRFSLLGADSGQDLWMKAMKMDVRLANFEYDVERLAVAGSVDFDLNKAVHNFQVDLLDDDADEVVLGGSSEASRSSDKRSDKRSEPSKRSGSEKSRKDEFESFGHDEMVKYIRDNFSKFKWENVKMENLCGEVPKEWENWELASPESELPVLSSLSESSADLSNPSIPKLSSKETPLTTTLLDSRPKTPLLTEGSPSKATTLSVSLPKSRPSEATTESVRPSEATTESASIAPSKRGGASSVLQFNPSQGFIKNYFTPFAPVKGMLLYHSTGSGKTCSAIAAATANFEPLGYTILWVTRTTLKNDIWKNMFDQVCHKSIQERITNGEVIPDVHKERMRLLSKAWRIRPMSYKQFSNLVSKKNQYYEQLVKQNYFCLLYRENLLKNSMYLNRYLKYRVHIYCRIEKHSRRPHRHY
jgi:hypothetical protein